MLEQLEIYVAIRDALGKAVCDASSIGDTELSNKLYIMWSKLDDEIFEMSEIEYRLQA